MCVCVCVCVCMCFTWACFPTAELLLLCQHGFIHLCMCRTQTLIAVTNLLASDVKENRWMNHLSSWMNQTSHKCPWNLSEVLRAYSYDPQMVFLNLINVHVRLKKGKLAVFLLLFIACYLCHSKPICLSSVKHRDVLNIMRR